MSELLKFAKRLERKIAQEADKQFLGAKPAKDPEMAVLYDKLNNQTKTISLLARNLSNAINNINRVSEEGHAADKSLSIDFYRDAMNRIKESLPIIDTVKQQLPGAIQTLDSMINTLQEKINSMSNIAPKKQQNINVAPKTKPEASPQPQKDTV